MNDDVERLRKKISYLESQLLYYKQHHRHCEISRQLTPPPDEGWQTGCSLVLAPTADFHLTTNDVSDPQSIADGLDGPSFAADGLTIITFDPLEHGKAKSRTKLPQQESQWRTVADQLLAKVPDATEWCARKESLGVQSAKDNLSVIRTVSGISVENRQVLLRARPHLIIDNPQEISNGLIALANAYAWKTKGSQDRATLACLLKSFQELIFVSLCAVLEHNGTNLGLVEEAMRICISNSDAKNLKRLRSGAVWANRMIIDLAENEDGWDYYRATDMVLLCGLSTSKYGILSTASKDSLPYLSTLLRTPKYTESESGILGKGPFSIPAFIKVLLDDNLTMENICTALHYPQCVWKEQDRLSSWYKNMLDVRPEGNALLKKRKLNTHQPISELDDECGLLAFPNRMSGISMVAHAHSNHNDGHSIEAGMVVELGSGHFDVHSMGSCEQFGNTQLDLPEQCEPVNPSLMEENTLQLLESQIAINNTPNADNNMFDSNNAYDLYNIAFDYSNAYDLTTIAFDYTNSYDLTTIALDDPYNFPALDLPSMSDPSEEL